MNFQVRHDNGAIEHYPSMRDAYRAALKDKTIWKISFTVGNERIRLLREGGADFSYDPISLQDMKASIEGEL